MSIIRTSLEFERDFTRIPNDWLRDGSLSMRARGLLAQLMSHAPGFRITIDSLVRDNPEGREAIRTAMKELQDAGYLAIERVRDGESGRLNGRDYVLTMPVRPKTRTTGDPYYGQQPTKKTTPKKINFQNNKSLKTGLKSGRDLPNLASTSQRVFLRDCFIITEQRMPDIEDEELWSGLTSQAADELIKDGWREIEHGSNGLLWDALQGFEDALSERALKFIHGRLGLLMSELALEETGEQK